MSKRGTYASPPRMAGGDDPTYFDPLDTDPEQARDVASWRGAEQTRLADLREGLGQTERAQAGTSICGHLATFRAARGVGRRPRSLATRRSGANRIGVRSRPICVTKVPPSRCLWWRPSVRRFPFNAGCWTPGKCMVRGHGDISAPPPKAVMSDIALAPCLGWDYSCYRLRWSDAYYDRTLAAAPLTTIYPQPHNIPLERLIAETGVCAERKDPTCH